MADEEINYTDGVYVIFYYCGKTMIGKFTTSVPQEISNSGGVHASLDAPRTSSNVYFVLNPAEIEFNLEIPSTGSADLNWKIKPLFYKDMIGSTNTFYSNVATTFPKSEVVLTNICASAIDSILLAAYKELCE